MHRNIRALQLSLATIGLTLLSLLISLSLRFDSDLSEVFTRGRIVLPGLLLVLFRYAACLRWKVNDRSWRYTSGPELELIVKAHVFSSLCFASSIFLFRLSGFPRSVIFIELAVSLIFTGAVRYLIRLIFEHRALAARMGSDTAVRDVVVLGAGDSGHLLVRNLLLQFRMQYRVVAVFDDSERLKDTCVHGVPIVGPLRSLAGFLAKSPEVTAAIVAIPSLTENRRREIMAACEQHEVLVKYLQSFEDIACLGEHDSGGGLSIETVLRKELRPQHPVEVQEHVIGRCVMVTGAGGSIGSEVVRQLIALQASKIILLDNCEYNLFEMAREISPLLPESQRELVLANVTNRDRLRSVLQQHQPQLVFHTAAFKHVPLLEDNCYEAFANNIIGTRNLLLECAAASVERFVLISTDKAVNPKSVMGSSKRVCESLVHCFNGQTTTLSCSVVRFGNVINSRGSVIPTFKKQIESGSPLTVTHPEVERFFMSIPEAVHLVLTAATMGDPGEVYVLDMGKKLKIIDVARKMRALYGRKDLPIEIVGLRPGEALTEELHSPNEELAETDLARVFRIANTSSDPQVLDWVAEVERRLPTLTDSDIGAMIRDYATALNAAHGQSVSTEHLRIGSSVRAAM